jgi:uncharacterized protein
MLLGLGLLLAFAIGASLGMLGGGGSVLTVPMLVYVMHLEPKPAIATSLLVVGVTSLAALVPHARAGRVDYRVGATFGAASMLGAFAGGRVAHFMPGHALLVAFALLMLVTGMAMLRGRRADAGGTGARATARVMGVGVGVGLLTGIVGAGGGFVIVPALALLCALPMPRAVATSLLIIAANSLSGFAGYAGTVPVDARLAALVAVSAVAGSILGARLAGRLAQDTLRSAFAWVVLAMSVFMLARETAPSVAGLAAAAIAIAAVRLRRRPA